MTDAREGKLPRAQTFRRSAPGCCSAVRPGPPPPAPSFPVGLPRFRQILSILHRRSPRRQRTVNGVPERRKARSEVNQVESREGGRARGAGCRPEAKRRRSRPGRERGRAERGSGRTARLGAPWPATWEVWTLRQARPKVPPPPLAPPPPGGSRLGRGHNYTSAPGADLKTLWWWERC